MNRMLRLDCPRCKAEFAVANPAVGSFCPVCNFCNTRFELFIGQDKNGQFYLDTGYISNIEVTQIRSPDSSETPLALIPIEEALDQVREALPPPQDDHSEKHKLGNLKAELMGMKVRYPVQKVMI